MRNISTKKIFIKIGTSSFAKKVWAILGKNLTPNKWIFIVGCYNSGSTLLSKILSEHPHIGSMPNEGIAFTDFLPYPEQFGWPRMWHRCTEKISIDPDALPSDVIRKIKKQWSIWYPWNSPNLLEKSISNTVRMPFFQKNFAPAYFISIVRNGYAVSEGIRRKAKLHRWCNPENLKTYPIELCARQWKITDDIIRRDSSTLDRYKLIYYEDLASDPSGVISELTEFLDLPPLDSEVFNRNWTVQEKIEPIVNMNPRSFQRMSSSDFDIIESVAGESLSRHGYVRPVENKNTSTIANRLSTHP